jgi:hypothetical protein
MTPATIFRKEYTIVVARRQMGARGPKSSFRSLHSILTLSTQGAITGNSIFIFIEWGSILL